MLSRKVGLTNCSLIYPPSFSIDSSDQSSRFTRDDGTNPCAYLPDRPAIVVSSTSWSEDEDFTLLFDALKSRDRSDLCSVNSEWMHSVFQNMAHKRWTIYHRSFASSRVRTIRVDQWRGVESRRVLSRLGKGPLKDRFVEQVERERDQYHHVEFCFPWLEADDYPLLIGSADLGVSLHHSSSSFDLPMKVVDMFAVGVPVCSVQYNW